MQRAWLAVLAGVQTVIVAGLVAWVGVVQLRQRPAATPASAGPVGDVLPVGTIVSFWGSVQDVPNDYELCDGGPPKPGSTLRGDKPNLSGRFLRGVTSGTVDARTNSSGRGGIDETPAYSGDTSGVALKVEQMPSHQHVMPIPNVTTEGPQFGLGQMIARGPGANGISDAPGYLTSAVGGGQTHSHPFSVPAHTNLPLYQEVIYIIKVR